MRIFDFNIHLPTLQSSDINSVISQDLSLAGTELSENLLHYQTSLKTAQGLNVMLFNTSVADEPKALNRFLNTYRQEYEFAAITALIDFRRSDIFEYLELLSSLGIQALMVNSYLQKIELSDFNRLTHVYQKAANLGFVLCVDGSYGTSKMYRYDNLKLACAISDVVPPDSPIVIIHSGGLRLLEAMLLAQDKPNVWLDTSFSLPYYLNSSLELDFAYAYKSLDCRRVVYGSDHPYWAIGDNLKQHKDFFNRHGFSEAEQTRIFFNNAMELFSF